MLRGYVSTAETVATHVALLSRVMHALSPPPQSAGVQPATVFVHVPLSFTHFSPPPHVSARHGLSSSTAASEKSKSSPEWGSSTFARATRTFERSLPAVPG